ncbi:FAD-binding domain-containing protein [Falsiroseomonas sp. HC035]|uniref:FAD-binding domain-containing protein n=1 Tax=Falsiroseomonas sp. HC035 TaxID=3390999 RepID=UPI003D320CB0
MMNEEFPADRAGALRLLADFAPRMGADYARGRNSDPGPGRRRDVSRLSPALRHRLVTEAEVVGTALAMHGEAAAQKFIQEVFWRSYWKGFLELRPALYQDYRTALDADLARLDADAALRARYQSAISGRTGIEGFDAWATELREVGWLHNHARMWFASIWIFTLRLPWTLGADHFLRHLLDGDAASNTLSWRWVAGIQTQGKPYVARAENIARFTGGRFNPAGQLDENPLPLEAPPLPPIRPLPPASAMPAGPVALLLHEDDLHPEGLLPPGLQVAALAGIAVPEVRSPRGCAPLVARHVRQALADGLGRAGRQLGLQGDELAAEAITGWAAGHGLPVVMPQAPVGWTADALIGLGLPLHIIRRDWDQRCWPLATQGFFKFRERISGLIAAMQPSAPSA